MISTGFDIGERESIAVAYANMYAPKRMNESRSNRSFGRRISEDASEEPTNMTDAYAKQVAAERGIPFDSVKNNPGYSYHAAKADSLADNDIGGNQLEDERRKALSAGFKKYGDSDSTYDEGRRLLNDSDIDANARDIAARNGWDFHSGTNNVAYQSAKGAYDAGLKSQQDSYGSSKSVEWENKMNKLFDDSESAFSDNATKLYGKRRGSFGRGVDTAIDGLENAGKGALKAVVHPFRMFESECCDGECCSKKSSKKLPTKHKVPAKTGSKLGVRKVLPFEKRDKNPSTKKFIPKVKKVAESTYHYCIIDGNKTLCTNDIGESYFNNGGITGDTRIYESKISAMKDIQKVKGRRNPNSKYKVRQCECIGESFQFVENGHMVNEGLFDGITKVGSGLWDATKAVGNTVGGVAQGVGSALQGDFKQAGKDVLGGLKDAGSNIVDAGKNVVGGAADATLGTAKNLTNAAGSVIDAAHGVVSGEPEASGESLMGAGNEMMTGVVGDENVEKVTDAAKSGAQAVGKAMSNGAQAVGKAMSNGAQAVGNFAQSVGNKLKQGVNAAGSGIRKAAGMLRTGANADAQKQQQTQQQQQTSQQQQTQQQQPDVNAVNDMISSAISPYNVRTKQWNPGFNINAQQQKSTLQAGATNDTNTENSTTASNAATSTNNSNQGNAGTSGKDTEAQKQSIMAQIKQLQEQLAKLNNQGGQQAQ